MSALFSQPVHRVIPERGLAAVLVGQHGDAPGSVIPHAARQTALRGADGFTPRIILCLTAATVRGNDSGEVACGTVLITGLPPLRILLTDQLPTRVITAVSADAFLPVNGDLLTVPVVLIPRRVPRAVRVTDGAGRRFHLALTTQAQRAEAFRKQRATSLSSPAGPRSASSSSAFPDTLPAGTEYGADNGIRLEAVWLTHDPAYPDEQPTAPLARYTYTASGELRAVYDRSGTQVRGFTYDAEHAGRMVAHHYAGRPESCYRYDDTGRVTEQVNPEGLDYRFEYGESRVIITDSLKCK